MSNATELLNGLTEDQVAAYSVNPDTEEHIVIGSNRIITVPAALKKIAVEHDHNVETVTFDCPRYWDGHDMSEWQVYINYILSNGYEDSYPADNVVADDTDETIMHFSWTISRNVTQVKGAITILVCIKETDEEGNEIRHWNSERNSELTVSAGMECTEKVVEENPDIVNQLLSRISKLEEELEFSNQTVYVVGEPTEFTLTADGWNGTTYTIVTTDYGTVGELQIGIPPSSSMTNAETMKRCALTIPQIVNQMIDTNGDGVTDINQATIYISAVTAPTEDIVVAIWGLTK